MRLWQWKHAVIDYLATQRLMIHETAAQVQPAATGIPWLGFVVYPTHRLVKQRNAVNFTRRFQHNVDLYNSGRITFAELDASVKGWINHVRYADTWGLRKTIFRPVRHAKPAHRLHVESRESTNKQITVATQAAGQTLVE